MNERQWYIRNDIAAGRRALVELARRVREEQADADIETNGLGEPATMAELRAEIARLKTENEQWRAQFKTVEEINAEFDRWKHPDPAVVQAIVDSFIVSGGKGPSNARPAGIDEWGEPA